VTAFEAFFAVEFPALLANVTSGPVFTNGKTIEDASWDRKAAYLLFTAGVRAAPPAPPKVEDLFG
jgi:hypothetical protein